MRVIHCKFDVEEKVLVRGQIEAFANWARNPDKFKPVEVYPYLIIGILVNLLTDGTKSVTYRLDSPGELELPEDTLIGLKEGKEKLDAELRAVIREKRGEIAGIYQHLRELKSLNNG